MHKIETTAKYLYKGCIVNLNFCLGFITEYFFKGNTRNAFFGGPYLAQYNYILGTLHYSQLVCFLVERHSHYRYLQQLYHMPTAMTRFWACYSLFYCISIDSFSLFNLCLYLTMNSYILHFSLKTSLSSIAVVKEI